MPGLGIVGLVAMIAFSFLYGLMNNQLDFFFCFYQILVAGKTETFKGSVKLPRDLAPVRRVTGSAFPFF